MTGGDISRVTWVELINYCAEFANIKLYRGGGGRFIVPLCDMLGVGYSLYKFVQNVGGGV